MRLAVLTNAPAPYRAPVFERLARAEGVVARIFFDGASDATTRAARHAFPCEQLPRGITLWRRSYQDEDAFAERRPIRFGWHLLPRLAAFRPDVVISGEFGWRTIQAAVYTTFVGVPLLVWWEGTPFTERHASAARIALRRVLASRAAALLGFGRESVAVLESLAPKHAHVHFVPQSVDNARIARETDRWRAQRGRLRAELGVRGNVLLCVSRLLPHKGLRELLAALERLHASSDRPAFSVLLVGDGPLREAAERAAERLAGDLIVCGAVSPAELPMYLAASDALVFPTLRDCWGMVVNEALAAGIPVLGSRYAGACGELLTRGDVGVCFDPLDPASFDSALRSAVVDEHFRETPVAIPRAAVSDHTCEKAAQTLLDAARGCLASRPIPRSA